MYLDPQDGRDHLFTGVVCLLHKHGESLDPLQVLEVFNPVYIIIISSANCSLHLILLQKVHILQCKVKGEGICRHENMCTEPCVISRTFMLAK